jgi:aminopeptidase C
VEDFMKLLMIHGNLISNPEFKDGFNNWQIETSLEERQYTLGKDGVFISSDANFDYSISQTVDIEYTGEYIAAVEEPIQQVSRLSCLWMWRMKAAFIHIQAIFSRLMSGL